MKRLLIRFLALATVVVLGLIAIAQAQRGNDDPAPIVVDTAAAPSETAPENTTKPIVVEPVSYNTPDAFAVGEPASGNAPNVLRMPTGTEVHAIDPPNSAETLSAETPVEVTPVSVNSDERYPGVVNPVASPGPVLSGPRPVAEPSGSVPPADPFGIRAAGEPAATLSQGRPEPSYRREPAPLGHDPRAVALNEPPPANARHNADDSSSGGAYTGRGAIDVDTQGEGTGRPGGKQLEGTQSPQLSIEKLAPAEIQVGKPAVFQVKVKNTGSVAANNVEVRDQIPEGTRLLDTNPQASRGARGELVWVLGTIKPGDQTVVEMRVMPHAEGEIGSVARVVFCADASVRTISTRPRLVIEAAAPKRVLIGEQVTLSITISNPGTGAASGVVLEEQVPPGLQHVAGAELEYEIGRLQPKESKTLELTLLATRPGAVSNVLIVRADAGLRVEEKVDIEVVAPELDLVLKGPQRRYLERKATYTLSVSNPGTAGAEGVKLAVFLPRGLKFVEADNNGHYEPETRAVHWTLAELPAKEMGTVELTTMPVESGRQKLRFRGTAVKVPPIEKEKPVVIEGIAAMLFEVRDVDDPIEVGGQTTYEIRVLNQGSKAAMNIRLTVLLPPGMKPLTAEGPGGTRSVVEGNQVFFDGLARLAPKADTTFRVRVQGLQPGDQRVRVQLQTDEMETPVTKEESTRVFSDQ